MPGPPGLPPMTPEQLANLPFMKNPSGAPPNFNTSDTTGPQAIAAMSVLLGVASIVVFLRLWVRLSITRHAGWDDIFTILSLLFSIPIIALTCWVFNHRAFGPHSWDVRFVTFTEPKVGVILIVLQILSNPANLFAKLAILLFIKRLFPRAAKPTIAYAIWFGIFLNVMTYVILIILLLSECVPRVGAHNVLPARCTIPFRLHIGIATTAINAGTDFYILLCAVPSLWMLQMPTRRKVQVVGVLCIGLVACGLSLTTLEKRARNDPMDDPARKQVLTITLGGVEPLIAIITACLPTMPALWTELSTNGMSSLRRLISRVGSRTSLPGRSQRTRTDGGDSLKSLQMHTLPRELDVEQKNKEPYGVLTEERNSL